MPRNSSSPPLLRKFSQLKERLAEVEDTLDAIRSGSVDALVVRTPRGEQLFTLKGADQTYRALVETMNEGALTLNRGFISFCNHHFARMARSPLERILGTSIPGWFPSAEFRSPIKALQAGARQRATFETNLRAADTSVVPVLVSASRFSADGKTVVSLVVSDITERKLAERVRRELSRRILNAQEAERQRVARDLHDSVNQLLSAAKYRLNSCSPRNANPPAHTLEQVRQLLEKAIAEVRLIGRNLRPSELDDLGLAAALRALTRELKSRYGLRIQCRCSVDGRLSAEVEMALYRIAQEALTNVVKHSQATRVELAIAASRQRVTLQVLDNGKGMPPVRLAAHLPGWGLKNMKERAHLLDGTFLVNNNRGKGTTISVTIPLLNHS